MSLVNLALRRPLTIVVLAIAVALAAFAALNRIPRDIFPNLDVPVIYIAQPYDGMDPRQMEGYLTHRYETRLLYVTGIQRIESKSIPNLALLKLTFYPGTDMANAMAETSNQVQRVQRFMPRGTVPPFVVRYDAGSIPVGSLVFSSDVHGENELQELVRERIRPMFAALEGVQAPPPMGGGERTIVIRVDPDRLRAYTMSPSEVIDALESSNIVTPSGNARIGALFPTVSINSVAEQISELGRVAVRRGTPAVYIRDVATIEDAAPAPAGYALVNGKRSVFMSVVKRADASTLSVVDQVKAFLPRFQAAMPAGVTVSYEFDQSYFVTRSINNLTFEGILGALLAGFMAFIFLRNWRSALVVVICIPLSLLAAVVGLWALGQTINLMTLAGLALAVGILVDEATVVVENIHTHRWRKTVAHATLEATKETVVPCLMVMLCILALFIPSFFMVGAIRAMFVPLSLAVGLAMVASYFLSVTLVPILSVWMFASDPHGAGPASGNAGAAQERYALWVHGCHRRRKPLIAAYLGGTLAVILGLGSVLGTEIFPPSDEGQLQLRFRGVPGTRIEETEQTYLRLLEVIRETAGPENVALVLGKVGTHPSSHPINSIFLWMSGSEEGLMQVQLKPGSGLRVEPLKERLRRVIAQRFPGLDFSFEPSDIVSRVLSFGSPTPVQVAVRGKDWRASRELASRLRGRVEAIPTLRDVAFEQRMDYPTLNIEIDRERVGLLGLTMKDVANAMVPATSSSRYIARNFWADPKTGLSYLVQVEYPPDRMNSIEELRNVPVAQRGDRPVLLRNVATIKEGRMVGEFDRHNLQRTATITANVAGEDLGRVARRVYEAVAREAVPPGFTVEVGGQIATMREMFGALASGLAVTIVALFLLLAAYFQSWRLAFIVVSTVPAVLAGVVLSLWITGTTLNIQSFMGGIMAVGVAVANAIFLVTFAERYRVEERLGVRLAAAKGARTRLRPILMTSLAMIAGMFPMALGVSEGGEQAASLGRAVIGGLVTATGATLFVLPAVFASLRGVRAPRAVSLDPTDPASRFYGV